MNTSSMRFVAVVACPMLAACTTVHPDLHVEHYDDVAFRNANVVYAERGEVLSGQTIHVVRGRIASITPSGEDVVAPGTSVIDAGGAFVVPGLGDMHVHHYPHYSEVDLLLYLVNGVTTVRIMDGSERDLETRQRISNGTLLGPRYFTCGPRLTYWERARNPAEAAVTVRTQAEVGFDCVKVYALRGEEETFRRVLHVADSLGIPTAGHFHWALPLELSLRLGTGEHVEAAGLQDFFEHEMPSMERHAALAQRIARSGIALTPTLRAIRPDYANSELLEAMLHRPETSFVPSSLRQSVRARSGYDRDFDEFQAQYRRAVAITGFLHDQGVRIVLGTDSGGGLTVPGFAVHDELQALVSAGLTPAEALVSATRNIATVLGTDGGTIEPGRPAEFFLVGGDPLEDIVYTRAIRGVFVGDTWIDGPAISKILALLQKP